MRGVCVRRMVLCAAWQEGAENAKARSARDVGGCGVFPACGEGVCERKEGAQFRGILARICEEGKTRGDGARRDAMWLEPMRASLAQSSQRLQPSPRGEVNTGSFFDSLAGVFREGFPSALFHDSTAKAADYFTR